MVGGCSSITCIVTDLVGDTEHNIDDMYADPLPPPPAPPTVSTSTSVPIPSPVPQPSPHPPRPVLQINQAPPVSAAASPVVSTPIVPPPESSKSDCVLSLVLLLI